MAVFAAASVATAALALPTLIWRPGLLVSVAREFAYSLVDASDLPSLLATLSEVPSALRGVLFGVNVTMASMGWPLAGALLAGVARRVANARQLSPDLAQR